MSDPLKFATDRQRANWVMAALRDRGRSYAAIARDHKVTPQAVRQALFLPSQRMELVLAEELGVAVEALFPERFDASGRRLSIVANSSNRNCEGNVNSGVAA